MEMQKLNLFSPFESSILNCLKILHALSAGGVMKFSKTIFFQTSFKPKYSLEIIIISTT